MSEIKLPPGIVSARKAVIAMARVRYYLPPKAKRAKAVHGDVPKGWPEPLGPAAFHGPLGEFAQLIDPYSEADLAAILIQTSIAFGSAAGRGPHFSVESTRHGCNLFGLQVGQSALSRKGTSWDRARGLVSAADPSWAQRNGGESGIASGEALIKVVRDAGQNGNGDPTPGVSDKRFCATHSEFGLLLGKMKFEGSSLGAQYRNAWDGRDMQNVTKSQELRATNPHISIIAHITRAELEGMLDETDVYNGFLNRYLIYLARRSKSLPDGGGSIDYGDLVDDVRRGLAWAHEKPRHVRLTDAAGTLWERVYEELAEKVDDSRYGAVVSRMQPQVRRLAMIYAVADRSSVVKVFHLKAALEIVRYCDESARFLFGGEPATSARARIYAYLSEQGGWVPRSAITTRFKNSFKSHELDSALDGLSAAQQVKTRDVRGVGRPRTEYRVSK